MADPKYDALKTWREENFGKFKGCGGAEDDPTARAIEEYERQQAIKQKQSQKKEEDLQR